VSGAPQSDRPAAISGLATPLELPPESFWTLRHLRGIAGRLLWDTAAVLTRVAVYARDAAQRNAPTATGRDFRNLGAGLGVSTVRQSSPLKETDMEWRELSRSLAAKTCDPSLIPAVILTVGEAVYRSVEHKLAARDDDSYIAIEPKTARWVVGKDRSEAMERYKESFGNTPGYLRRIGTVTNAGRIWV